MTDAPRRPQAIARCPICRRPADPRLRPFCSARCADVDLGRWFGEQYRVATAEPEPGRDEGADEEG
jgi:endogenous inhibitor of DNA gyrase (YacG/DUF329 family)